MEDKKPKLIDEWQEATNLWDEIRYGIDKTELKGQYILIDSSTFKRTGILHSDAGKFGKIQLRTMSLYKSSDSTGDVSLKKLARLIIRGGWPANISYSSSDSKKMVN